RRHLLDFARDNGLYAESKRLSELRRKLCIGSQKLWVIRQARICLFLEPVPFGLGVDLSHDLLASVPHFYPRSRKGRTNPRVLLMRSQSFFRGCDHTPLGCDASFERHRFAIRKSQHVELNLRILEWCEVTIQDRLESPLP